MGPGVDVDMEFRAELGRDLDPARLALPQEEGLATTQRGGQVYTACSGVRS